MFEKIFGTLAVLAFIVFSTYIASKIGEPDLWAVVVVVSALAAYDFYLQIVKGEGNRS